MALLEAPAVDQREPRVSNGPTHGHYRPEQSPFLADAGGAARPGNDQHPGCQSQVARGPRRSYTAGATD